MKDHVTFTILAGPSAGHSFTFCERHECQLGRAGDCELKVPGSAEYLNVSRHHCAFDINPPHVRVRDNGSLNGTYVNGVRLPPSPAGEFPCELRDGDQVYLGCLALRVAINSAEDDLPGRPPCGVVGEPCGPCSRARSSETVAP